MFIYPGLDWTGLDSRVAHHKIALDGIQINQRKLRDILKGISAGCKISNCELVGGETAEMPGTYSKGKFDIAGFCVGLVEKSKILNKFLLQDVLLAVL